MSYHKCAAAALGIMMLFTMEFQSLAESPGGAYTESAAIIQNKTELTDEVLSKAAASSRFTRPETGTNVRTALNLEGFQLLMENEDLAVYLREETMGLRILNKRSGYIWGALPQDKPDNMNANWSAFANSMVSIEYMDELGQTLRKYGIGSENVVNTWEIRDNIFICTADFLELGISFTFKMTLQEDTLLFSLDDTTIEENELYYLCNLYFLPFLGSVCENETDGYIFIPDGPGALIRFDTETQYMSGFEKRVYGIDYGIDSVQNMNDIHSSRPNEYAMDENQVLMPVYGMAHGAEEDAWAAIIEQGEEYAEIVANPGGVLTSYYWATSKFVYRQRYLQPISRAGNGVYILQKDRNVVNPQVQFSFLNGESADYVGMALRYQEYLLSHGLLGDRVEADQQDIPVTLDFVSADIEKGLIFAGERKDISSLEMIREVSEYLQEESVSNAVFILKGWQKGGLNGHKLMKVYDKTTYGTLKILEDLKLSMEDKGYQLELYLNATRGSEYQISKKDDAGINLSQTAILIQRENENVWLDTTYFVRTGLAGAQLLKQTRKLKDSGLQNVAVDYFGTDLYAENELSKEVSRKESMEYVKETLSVVKEETNNLSLYRPNAYAWQFTDTFLDCPVNNSQFLYETDTVPFLQIVLSGYVAMAAPYSNVNFYSPTDLLRQIEYNLYPSFLFTEESNYNLVDTGIAEYSSTMYADWSADVIQVYHMMNKVLRNVIGQRIKDRAVLSKGIVRVDYETGSIFVNYTGNSYTCQDIEIPAISARYVEKGDKYEFGEKFGQ